MLKNKVSLLENCSTFRQICCTLSETPSGKCKTYGSGVFQAHGFHGYFGELGRVFKLDTDFNYFVAV